MKDAFHPPADWKSRIAPTEVLGSGMLRGIVHDGNARMLGGVAGHAGLFSTADDLARFCRMLVRGGELNGRRYLQESSIKAMLVPHQIGETTRGLGWDMSSAYSRALGSFFPMGSVGHTGFTGTSIWIDPPSRVYAIILTNRVHPYGKGNVVVCGGGWAGWWEYLLHPRPRPLTCRRDPRPPPPGAPRTGATRTRLDQLAAGGFAPLVGRSAGS
jgi:CubicO group peptidase (beta-lactamase class C family)